MRRNPSPKTAIQAVRHAPTRQALDALLDQFAEDPRISDYARRIAALEARVDQTGEGGRPFVKVDPRVVEYNPSGTAGDGTYQAASTVDFSSSVAAGAKKVYIYVLATADNPSAIAPGFGFTWKPTGWTDTLEVFSIDVKDTTVEEHAVHCLPMSDALTVDIAVVKIDNGVGDAWAYSFEVWGYE